MEISQYIKDLLLTHDQVVLADFGTFTAKYKPAQIQEDTNTMTPPSKEVIFDSSAIVSNGLLEKRMGQTEHIKIEEAKKQIQEYVKTLKSKLNAGKKVAFLELGTFTKIKEGIILFTYLPTGNLLLDSFGLPKISLPDSVKSISPNTSNNEPKKKKKGWIIWLAVAAVLIIGIFALFYFKPTYKTKTFAFIGSEYENVINKFKGNGKNKISKEDSSLVKDNDSNVLDTNKLVENNSDTSNIADNNNDNKVDDKPDETYVEPINNNDKNSGQYRYPEKGKSYLIVSSLATAKDAEKEKKMLSEKGIVTQIIPSGAGKYRLTLGIYSKVTDAQAVYETFHQNYPSRNAWLWEYK